MKLRRVDFQRTKGAPWLGWLLLVVGIAAAAAAVAIDRRWSAERELRQTAARQQQERDERARRAAQRPALPAAESRRLGRVRASLQQPWLPTLRAIETSTEEPIFLLALTIDPATGRLKLEGEAADFDGLIGYVKRLDDDAALDSAQLMRHETVRDAVTGQDKLRFTVGARWSDR
jgi:hypothetical protein